MNALLVALAVAAAAAALTLSVLTWTREDCSGMNSCQTTIEIDDRYVAAPGSRPYHGGRTAFGRPWSHYLERTP